MQFTLFYDGDLPPKGRSVDKQRIRQVLHPQLKEVWSHHPLAWFPKWLTPAEQGELSALVLRGDRVFAAIVHSNLGLVAELQILLLRQSKPGGVVSNGDIDNRLKTLLDALSAPSEQQIQPSSLPTTLADPTHVLLEDDSLITRVDVEADRLLGLAGSAPDRTVVSIRVRTRLVKPMAGNLALA